METSASALIWNFPPCFCDKVNSKGSNSRLKVSSPFLDTLYAPTSKTLMNLGVRGTWLALLLCFSLCSLHSLSSATWSLDPRFKYNLCVMSRIYSTSDSVCLSFHKCLGEGLQQFLRLYLHTLENNSGGLWLLCTGKG